MFDIGTPELIMILVLALLIIGPKDLPRIGREVGKVFRSFRKVTDDVKESINQEIKDVTEEVDHSLDQEEKGEKLDKRIGD